MPTTTGSEKAKANLAEAHGALDRAQVRTPTTVAVECAHPRCEGRTIPDFLAVVLEGESLCPRHGFERAREILDDLLDPRTALSELQQRIALVDQALLVANICLARVRARRHLIGG